MDSFLKLLDNLLEEINGSINDKIIGINYLENIKYKLIEKLILVEKKILEDFKSDLSDKKSFSKKYVPISIRNFPRNPKIILRKSCDEFIDPN